MGSGFIGFGFIGFVSCRNEGLGYWIEGAGFTVFRL